MYWFILSSHVILLKCPSKYLACSTRQAVGTNSLHYCHYASEQTGICLIMAQDVFLYQRVHSCRTLESQFHFFSRPSDVH